MIIGRQLVEDQYEEKLYSTGDDYLDEMLEKAFCDGYEYAQREFGNPANKAAKKAWESLQGQKVIMNKAAKNKWDSQTVDSLLKNKGDVIRAGRKEISRIVPKNEGLTIKEAYKKSNINDKINMKNELVSSKNTKLRLQHSYEKPVAGRPNVEFKELGNSRKLINKSNISKTDKNNLLHSYDHGMVDKRGRLLSGRDMGYNNYEHNLMRANSGQGYSQTW